MKSDFSELFKVHIPFNQSHLFFPHIISWLLVILLAAILVVYGPGFVRDVRAGKRDLPFRGGPFDKLRFFGTIALTIVYFQSMAVVGNFFPNEGLGFLFMSVPFMFILSLLYAHGVTWRKLMIISLNALIAPSIAWYILENLFNISLP